MAIAAFCGTWKHMGSAFASKILKRLLHACSERPIPCDTQQTCRAGHLHVGTAILNETSQPLVMKSDSNSQCGTASELSATEGDAGA